MLHHARACSLIMTPRFESTWRLLKRFPAGMFNAMSVQPLVAAERVVFYRGEIRQCSARQLLCTLLGWSVSAWWCPAAEADPFTSAFLPYTAPPLGRIALAERAAMLYSPGPYSLALGLAEVCAARLRVPNLLLVRRTCFPVEKASAGAPPKAATLPPRVHHNRRCRPCSPLQVPYLLLQVIVMVNITYWLVHFSHTAWKYFVSGRPVGS